MENKFSKDINYYKVLQVDSEANPLVIKNSYYTILNQLKCHPDKGGDEENAKIINEAYRILSSERLREKYDSFLKSIAQQASRLAEDTIKIIHPSESVGFGRQRKRSFSNDFFSMDSSFDQFFKSVFSGTSSEYETIRNTQFPPTNIGRIAGGIIIKMEVPGVQWTDLHIEVENAILTVNGEKIRDYGDWVQEEFFYGPFSRSFQLPSQLDQDKITASLKNGILEIELPLGVPRKGKRIPID